MALLSDIRFETIALPKLISRELRVKDAKWFFEAKARRLE